MSGIIEEVRLNGDSALVKFSQRFDSVELSPTDLRITRTDIENAYSRISEEQLSALKCARNRLATTEKSLLNRIVHEEGDDDIVVRTRLFPLRSVGCYVPGGEASYPSTLVMVVTPAKIAGVPRIVVCTPPRPPGGIHPLTLVAADICGVDEIYQVGGAQAIAALACGTEAIEVVDKIVGPGNRYVTAAKRLLSREVPIDFPAGPTEIMVLADESADPRLVALDMVSQAEHGRDSTAILVTDSGGFGHRVLEELRTLIKTVDRERSIGEALTEGGLILLCDSMAEAVEVVNDFAPEHLEVISRDPEEILRKITSAGLVLMGGFTPVSASDYCLGTNHVLPTNGFGTVDSGLSILDFGRLVRVAECTRRGLARIREPAKILAEAEGLPNHAAAIEGRFSHDETA